MKYFRFSLAILILILFSMDQSLFSQHFSLDDSLKICSVEIPLTLKKENFSECVRQAGLLKEQELIMLMVNKESNDSIPYYRCYLKHEIINDSDLVYLTNTMNDENIDKEMRLFNVSLQGTRFYLSRCFDSIVKGNDLYPKYFIEWSFLKDHQ